MHVYLSVFMFVSLSFDFNKKKEHPSAQILRNVDRRLALFRL